jgi:hypothetical protein
MKRKRKQTHPVGLGHQHGLLLSLYSPAGWIGASTRLGSAHQRRQKRQEHNCGSTYKLHSCEHRTKGAKPTAEMRSWGQTPPPPKGRRLAGLDVAVMLHRHRPPDSVKNTESEATHVCAGTANPPLSTPLSCAGTSNPPHGTTLRSCLKDCCRSSPKKCPAPIN